MKEYFKKHLINFRGKKSKKKILVIESDDWGAIRIPNSSTKEKLIESNLIQTKDTFSNFDILESESDYLALFDILKKYKDFKGNHAIITTNMVMGNPHFDKIRSSSFSEYFWEPFHDTYISYYPNLKTLDALHTGIQNGFIYPQFHAHEHLNIFQWLQRLQSGDERFLKAFDFNCFAIDDINKSNFRANLMATYDYRSETELEKIKTHIELGLRNFEEVFGFKSYTTIAPCYVWNSELENIFYQNNIKGLQSSYVQMLNSLGSVEHKRVWRQMGTRNKSGQLYTIRNVLFEPALNPMFNWVDKSLESIEIAFFWNQPAVLASHRLNFVAGLSEQNRAITLKNLDLLLSKVLKKWPDIQFMNSAQLLEEYE